ncbi:hypothetical protein MKEN_00454600 [Mycena kentingensis (nom. inval.)]|nr:hypothetical protein MKEN_00454600 [Mycena kentingensis (nom. inval.)]
MGQRPKRTAKFAAMYSSPSYASSSKLSVASAPHHQPTTGSEPKSKAKVKKDAKFLADAFLPPPDARPTLPIYAPPRAFCLPQLTSTFDAPFVRAYSPALEDADISQAQLLAFVDGLNVAITASPPLRVLDWSGAILGLFPSTTFMLAGAALQIVGQAGAQVLSSGLTERYLASANQRLFHPRGLSVQLCTTAAMQHLAAQTLAEKNGDNATPEPQKPSRLDRVGRAAGTLILQAPIRLPYTSKIVHKLADKAPAVAATDVSASASASTTSFGYQPKAKMLPTLRRLAAVEDLVLPLVFDVPPPAKPEGVRNMVQSWGVRADRWVYGQSQSRVEKKRWELNELEREDGERYMVQGKQTPAPWNGGYTPNYFGQAATAYPVYDAPPPPSHPYGAGPFSSGALNSGGYLTPPPPYPALSSSPPPVFINAKDEKKRRKKKEKLEQRMKDHDLLEHWESDKVLWIVVTTSDADGGIDSVEMADDEDVDLATWQTQLKDEKTRGVR